jgi:carbonic anhydrase/acetyltransferase-like protein (isoleucine patch superfamily)
MIRDYKGKTPEIDQSVFLAETAVVIGDVVIGERSNIWYGAVLRGDEGSIIIGNETNIQDNSTVHTSHEYPVRIGDRVTVGHNAVVHGCQVGDGSMIGMGAIVLNGAVIGKGCIIAAGALVKEKEVIPDGSLCVGVPARIVRQLDEKAQAGILANGEMYVALGQDYKG